MVQAPKRKLGLLVGLLALSFSAHADGVYTRTVVRPAAATSSGGSTSPGGTSGQVQFNNAGSFGGMTNSVVSGNNISFGGNISAPSATFTNVADTALTSGTIPFASTGGLFLDSGATWTPATSIMGIAGGISASGIVSSSRVAPANGTAALPGFYFQGSSTSGMYRPGNNQINITLAGADAVRFAQTTMGVFTSTNTPSATFHVGTAGASGVVPGSGMFAGQLSVGVGTGGASVTVPNGGEYVSGSSYITGVISSTTGYVHLGSPTTPPTCDATNKGNVFMNTTTNCLNYCNGTSNIQITSTAGTCT